MLVIMHPVTDDEVGEQAERAERAAKLLRRARHANDPDALAQAIDLLRSALRDAPLDDPLRPRMLSNLSAGLLMRFERTGTPTDLDDAVEASRQAVVHTSVDDGDLAGRLSNLSATLRARFRRSGQLHDLDQAETAIRLAVTHTPSEDPKRAGRLANLAAALLARFDYAGERSILDEALDASRQSVVATDSGDVNLAGRLSNLAAMLLTCFERDGARPALDEAITVSRQAVTVTPIDDPDRGMMLTNLSVALRTRFDHAGAWADLDEAISTGRESLTVTPVDHPDRIAMLSNFGNALHARFEHTGAGVDIDEAVQTIRAAATATPAGHADMPARLSDLGAALQSRFRHAGNRADLDEAVAVGRRAAKDVPLDGPRRAAILSNLGNALQSRFEGTGVPADLDEAVDAMRRAVAVLPDDHPDHAAIASSLGNALLSRFELTGDLADVAEAINVGRDAVRVSPTDDPGLAARLSNLGLALHTRFEHDGDPPGLAEALDLWAQAASLRLAPVIVRLRAARRRAEAIALVRGPAAASPAYTESVDLLPLLVWRGASRLDQQHLLHANASALAREAAACAVAAGEPRSAVQLLEAGRSVLWGHMLDARTDLTALEQVAPMLAGELRQCRAAIEQLATYPGTVGTGMSRSAPSEADREAGIRMARRFDELVEQVRLLPPSPELAHPEQFLRPPPIESLLPGPHYGPTVVINVSRWRCDALIVQHDHVDSLPLPDVTYDEVIARVNQYLEVLQDYETAPTTGSLSRMDDIVTQAMGWLWDHITEPILSSLGYLRAPTRDWPRLWWCPTGALTLLPLHAAGYHHRTGDSVLDRVVSSYTPTLRSLTQARAEREPTAPPKILVVAVPHTPQHGALPGAATEARLLCAWFEAGHRTVLADSAATREAFLAELARHRWLHAACHGTQDLAEPSAGGLVPHDWASAGLVGITDLTRHDHAGGDFAFLSACKTATGGANNLDEAITAAAALQYAGWRHVIGTLWSVWDRSTVAVTRGVYPPLIHNGLLNPDRAAHALHHTIRRLRDRQPERPSTWAPFIHIGP